ncbi:MAG: Na+/H+ antiporter subunit B [Myxococcota bacterium]|nr:Na+/H+ antiporter subunit B [Myxococcota bacterium]
MRSTILQTSTRLLQPVILFFSFALLLRGHDHPGGGFVGGLSAAAAIVLHALAFGNDSARRALRLDTRAIAALGLAIATLTATAPLVFGDPLLHAEWATVSLGTYGALTFGTPLIFDLGVYLLVLGSSLTIVLTLGRE